MCYNFIALNYLVLNAPYIIDFLQVWWLASGANDAASVKTAITNYIEQGRVLESLWFGKNDSDSGLGFFGDGQNITDWAFSRSSGPGHMRHSAKYMASSLPFIIHVLDPLVIFTSPIYENTPLPMCSPLPNASCSISMMWLKVQPAFSRCLWFCFLVSSTPRGFTVYNSLD